MRRRGVFGMIALAAMAACSPPITESEERGDRYSARGDYADAQVEYALALEQAGRDAPPDLRLKAADLALRSKDFRQADRLFADLLEDEDEAEYGDRVEALVTLHAHRWVTQGDTFAALRAIDWLQARDSTASLGALYYTIGDAAYVRPDYDAAITAYLTGLARVPQDASPEVQARLGEAFDRRRNCAAAVPYFQRYLDASQPDEFQAGDIRYRLGACAFRLAERAFANQDMERAGEYLDLMVRTGEPVSRLIEADLMRARIAEWEDDREAAMDAYRRVLDRGEGRQTRATMEAFRRLKQLEFGLPLRTAERAAEEQARQAGRAERARRTGTR